MLMNWFTADQYKQIESPLQEVMRALELKEIEIRQPGAVVGPSRPS